jgi:hypothetical protein
VRATLRGAARQPVGAADENAEQDRLHQTECSGLADISAFVIVEQQHRHHHGVAGVEKQRRAEFADRQHEQQRHGGDHARPRQRQHDGADGAEHALAADPGGFLELAMDLQERGRQRLHRIRHEARDEGQREDPDGAVEPAGNADPGPQISDADHEARDRYRQRRYQVNAAAARHMGAVNGVADRKRQSAADHGGDDADLDRIVDRVQRQRVVEDAVEMHQRILLHVEQAGDIADEHEFAECRHDQSQTRQHHDHQQIDDPEPEGEPAPGAEIEVARPVGLAGHGGIAAPTQHLLLRKHQQARHHHQQDRDRRGGVVERRRPVGELENVSRQHGKIGRRAQYRRNAVDAEHHDKGQQHAGDDRRHDQRKRHREQSRECAGAGNFGGLFQARIHVAQRRGGEHVDVGRVIDAEHEHQSPQRIEIHVPVEAHRFEKRIDEAGFGRAEDGPCHARDQRRREQRQDAGRGDKTLERRVGAHHDPGKCQPDHDRDQGSTAAGDQRIEQRLGYVRIDQYGKEIGDRQMVQAKAVDHRIGVGQRTQQQCEHGIDHQKAEDRQQQRDPQASHDTPANVFPAAARDPGAPVFRCRPGAPACLSVQSVIPLSLRAAFLFLLPPSLVDGAGGGK